jgi:hypothetical protein
MEWNVYNHIVAQDKGIGFIGSMLVAQKTRPYMSCSKPLWSIAQKSNE